jgi:hypothetical protein
VDALFRRPESVVDEHPANAITPANKEMPKSALLCLIILLLFLRISRGALDLLSELPLGSIRSIWVDAR